MWRDKKNRMAETVIMPDGIGFPDEDRCNGNHGVH